MMRGVPKPGFLAARAGRLPKLVDGSARVLCGRCRKYKVWITPAQRKMMKELHIPAVCPACAPKARRSP
jgi:hypothetical protein